MTQYIVHIYREMRLAFADIEADTAEAAAAIARRMTTDESDNIEDCNGEDLSALVDLAGDETSTHSVTLDFEAERMRKAAPALLTALIDLMADLEDLCGEFSICHEIAKSNHGKAAFAAISRAKAAGVVSLAAEIDESVEA